MKYHIPVSTRAYYLMPEPSPASHGSWMFAFTAKAVTYTEKDFYPRNRDPEAEYVFTLPPNDRGYLAIKVGKGSVIIKDEQ